MKRHIGIGVIVVGVVLVGIFLINSGNDGEEVFVEVVSERGVQEVVDFEIYDVDYMNDRVRGILVKKVGANGRTAFYLPDVGYVNVSRGAKFGVAWLMQNVEPNVPDGNYFEFRFAPDLESLGDCGVSEDEAMSWIERGWSSSGMISGQWREDYDEWSDAMTVYFSFPAELEPCSVRYDFVLERDGEFYDSRVLEFNLV